MIDVYYFPSPNTWKVTIMLEECALPYRILPVNIQQREQFAPEFLKISPNNKVPAIVDHETPEGPVSVFESGAILVYLAEKTGRFLAKSGAKRARTLEWLFWQVGGLGPTAGQTHYFRRAAPEDTSAQAIERFTNESTRLYGVINRRLEQTDYLAGDYSIADMACWCWVWFHDMHLQDLADFRFVARWFDAIAQRPAVLAGRRVGLDLVPEDQRPLLEDSEPHRHHGAR
jgi:GSH-dependent disulfide-bond oxidoreductase